MLAFFICYPLPPVANLPATYSTLLRLLLTLCNHSVSRSCLPPLQSSQTDLRVQVSSARAMGMRHALLPACESFWPTFPQATTHPGFVLPHPPPTCTFLRPLTNLVLCVPCLSLATSPGGTLAKSLAETPRGCCWVWRTGEGLSWCERAKPPKVRGRGHVVTVVFLSYI